MKYKIIFLDIDGTLTNSEKRITPKTKNALLKAADSGLIIAVASGRPETGLNYVVSELELKSKNGYILPFNGGIVKSTLSGEVLFDNSLSYNTVKSAYDIAEKFGLNAVTYKNGEIITEHQPDEYVLLESRINAMPIRIVDSFLDEIDFNPIKCLLAGNPEIAANAEKAAQQEIMDANVFRSEPFFVEIMPKGIDKAASIEKLISMLGIKREEVIACGDGFNDVSMIEFAGLGVAMANGCEPAKKSADYIALSNDDDGIAEVIEKFVL